MYTHTRIIHIYIYINYICIYIYIYRERERESDYGTAAACGDPLTPSLLSKIRVRLDPTLGHS